ncbi:hypothetical protein, partial [Acinetobacter baumannii]
VVAAYLSAFLDMPMCFLTREWARIIAGFTRICEEPFYFQSKILRNKKLNFIKVIDFILIFLTY